MCTLSASYAQKVAVCDTLKPDFIVDSILVGNGIRVGNIKYTGSQSAMGYFKTDTTVIGMRRGLIMCSGDIRNAIGPNNTPGRTAAFRLKDRDKDLVKISKQTVYDVAMLEFDFVPYNNHVVFKFCFASEEYEEYVGSSFNDVFGFFIAGDTIKKRNIAFIPDTKTGITINNVNQNKNSEYYISNDPFLNFGLKKKGNQGPHYSRFKLFFIKLFGKKHKGKDISLGYIPLDDRIDKLDQAVFNTFQYDGFTKVITASCELTPWRLYHLKIAIADVGDKAFDSGVFIEEGSFSSYADTAITNYHPYPDLSTTMNWDSIFKVEKPVVVDTVPPPVVVEEEKFLLSNVYFATAEYVIPDSSKLFLDKLAAFMLKNKQYKCEIRGYTDSVGSKKYNQALSENRAKAVMSYLQSKRIDKSRLNYLGHNFEDPAADNTTEKGRARNRRVELTLIDID